MKTLIRTDNICRLYRSGREYFYALKNASIEIKKGEFISITGSSGSGKSTLMNILGLLDLPDSGEYYFDGVDISTLSDKAMSRLRNLRIGFIFQSFNLIANLTAEENAALPLLYRGVSKRERIKKARAALAMVGLDERLDHRPYQLSGGQQQRTAIARVLASEPEIILADEPCGNLDSKNSREIMELLRKLNNDGKTVVLITHDEKAAEYAGRIYRVRDGIVI